MSKPVVKDREYYLNDARNMVWGCAFLYILPFAVMGILHLFGAYDMSGMDGVAIGIISFLATLSSVTFWAGWLCGKGKKLGRILGYVFVVPMLPQFPIGTAFSVGAIMKLSKVDFIKELE